MYPQDRHLRPIASDDLRHSKLGSGASELLGLVNSNFLDAPSWPDGNHRNRCSSFPSSHPPETEVKDVSRT